MNALTIPVTLASNLMLAACGLAFVSAAPSEAGTVPIPRSGPCNLPTTRDLIIWQRAPQLQDSAFEVGDADLVHCKPTLDTGGPSSPPAPATVPRSHGLPTTPATTSMSAPLRH